MSADTPRRVQRPGGRVLRGRLVMTGEPTPGAMHDSRAWTESGLAARFAGRLHGDGGPGGYADLGYLGTGLLTPIRKPKAAELTTSARDFNRQVAAQRACAERAIAHLKNWRFTNKSLRALIAGLLGSDYRPGQMTYDLRRLRVNGLIRRLPHSHRYMLTADGIRIAVFYTKVYQRLLVPLTAADQPQAPPELRAALSTIDRHVDTYTNQARLPTAA